MFISIRGTADRLEVQSFFQNDGTSAYRIDQLRFADGTIWDTSTLKARALYGTRDSDSLAGYASADEIIGGAGEDSMAGQAGNDTLNGADGSDTLQGDDGNDVLFGGDQNDQLTGGIGNDSLDGGAGNDSLDGGTGNDTYTFGRGAGNDTIGSNDATSGKLDVLQFTAGVAPADVQANRTGNHLVLWIRGTPDRIQVTDYFTAASNRVEQIRFTDGTTWDFTAVQAVVAQGANWGAQVLTSMAGASDQITFQQIGNNLLVQGVGSKEATTIQGWYGQGTRVDQFTASGSTALLAAAPAAGLLGTANRGADQTTRLFHDTLGRLVGQLDAENRLTENVYDSNGNLTKTIRYSQPVLLAAGATVRLGEIRPAFDTKAQVTTQVYDLMGRVVEQTDPEGTVTRFAYDTVGNLVSTSRAVGTAEVRQVNARYDLQGRLTGELSAEGVALLTGGQTQGEIDAIWQQHGLTHTYDAAGRRTSTTDALGHKTRFYYDSDGRLTHTVNALGEVEERRYDSLNQLATTLRLGTRLDAGALAGLSGGLVDAALQAALSGKYNAALDRIERYTYTTRGQVGSTTNASGLLVDQHYDTFGDAVGTTTHLENGETVEQTRTFDHRGLQVSSITNAQAVTRTTYDAYGRVVASVDANGALRQQNYDRMGRVIQTVDATGSVRQSTWDAFDRVLTQTDALGQTTRYAYDETERSAVVTTPEGVSVKTVHTRHGQTQSVSDALGATTTYTYDRNGNLTGSSGPMGAQTSSSYDRANHVIRTTDARGVVTAFSYDAANRVLTRQVDPAAQNLTTTYEYDALGQQYRVTDPRGTLTTIAYDVAGRVLKQIVDPAGLRLETSYSYDLRGNTVGITDPAGTVSVFTYDKLGRRTDELIDANGLQLTRHYTHDLSGNVLTSTDPMGHVTRYAYDAENRLVYTVDPENGVTELAYDASGRLTRTTRYLRTDGMVDLPTPASRREIAARVIKSPGQDAVEARRYDRDGRVRFTVDGTGAVVEFKYDTRGNLIERVGYANTITLATWDGRSDPAPVADATRDQRVRTAYDAANRASHVVDAMGAVTANVYGAGGDLIRQTQYANPIAADAAPDSVVPGAFDRVTRFEYDAAGRLAWTADPEGGVTRNEYDQNGNLARQTRFGKAVTAGEAPSAVHTNEATNRVTTFQHDRANRTTLTVDAEGYATGNTYDAAGRIKSTTRYVNPSASGAQPASNAADQTTRYEYDGVGRLSSTMDALLHVERYTYNGRGDKITFENKKGSIWEYTYDAVGRLLTEKAPAVDITTVATDERGDLHESITQSVQLVTTLAYDGLGNLLSRTEATGLAKARTTTYGYDAAGRQVRVTHPPVAVYTEAASAVAANGATSVATRVEETRALSTQTFYDAFGNAVANIDVANNASFKVYDLANRVRYSIDAMRYVTEYTRNAFGDATWTTRYATAITGLPAQPTSATQAPKAAWVQSTLAPLPHTADRKINTEFDRLGHAVVVREPLAYAYDSTSGASGNAQKVTRNEYNAFGELARTGVLRSGDEASGTWAWTYQYHDGRGLLTDTVDALGYRTTQAYDAQGNLASVTEFATALSAGTWGVGSPGAATTHANDRKTTYTYDQLNRKASETRVGVAVSNAAQAIAGMAASANTTTSYAYDAVGNLTRTTDALGNKTYSYYDALGRVTAVAAPTRPGAGNTALAPLSLFRRDAYGNVVVKVDLALGAQGTVGEFTGVSTGSQLGALVGSLSAADRTTLSDYDVHGHSVQVTDAAGYSTFTSYNERGQVAKTWQGVTSGAANVVNGKLVADSTVFKVFQYDALGQLTHTLDPGVATTLATQAVPSGGTVSAGSGSGSSGGSSNSASAGGVAAILYPTTGTAVAAARSVIDTGLKYNAFGEVIRKGINGGDQEYFDYDNAGHLWRTNTGDGVDKIYLQDRQGNTTAELRSAGMAGDNADLKILTGAAQADALTTLRRTETLFDALGHVTGQRGAARSAPQDGVSVQNQFSTNTVVSTANVITGSSSMGPMTAWNGTNQVDLAWPDLLRLGTGEVRVTIEYTTVSQRVGPMKTDAQGQPYYDGPYTPVETRTRSADYTAEQAGDGVSMTWTDPDYVVRTSNEIPDPTIYPAGGIDTVSRIIVSKKDSAGVWHVLSDGAPGAATNAVEVAAPADGGAAMSLVVRVAGSNDAWTTIPGTPVRYGDTLRYPSTALPPGTYEYQLTSSLWYAWQGPATTRTGVITIGGSGEPGTGSNTAVRPAITQITDRWGNVVSVSDPRYAGWNTTYTYNANNQITSEHKPDGAESFVYYDALGHQVATRDARGNVNAQAYDAGGNLVAEHHADGGVVRHGYNAFGDKVTTLSAEAERLGAAGVPLRFAYDKMGRLVETDHGLLEAWTVNEQMQTDHAVTRIRDFNVYDQAGRKLSQTLGAGDSGGGDTVRYQYDLAGRVIETTQAGGDAFKLRTVYDVFGHKVADIDQNNFPALSSFDYFGLLLDRTDLGGARIHYTYDRARQLLNTTNSRYANNVQIVYEYDTAGQVIKVTDRSLNQVTEYAYDLAGRHVRERTTQAGKVYQDNLLAYDNVGRLRHVGDGRMSIDIAYDKAGNRTQLRTHANVPNIGSAGEVSKDSDHRFTYDNMNRQTGVDLDENFQLTLGGTGHILTYDLDGNRATDKFFGNLVTEVPATPDGSYTDNFGEYHDIPAKPITYVAGTGNDDVIVERYSYDTLNRLTSVKRNGLVREGAELAPLELDHRGYDTVGRVITTGPVSLPTGYASALNSGTAPGHTIGLEARTNRYDSNGRLVRQFVYNSDRTSVDTDIAYQSYDAAGNLLKYELTKPNDYSNFYEYRHVRFDGYKESVIEGSSTKFSEGTTIDSYDVNGNLVKVFDIKKSENNRSFVNDLAGHALYVNQDGNVQRQVVVNGEVLGRHGIGINEQSPRTDDGNPRFTQIADFDVGFQRITGNYPTASVGTYQVQAGDTLRSIARQSYGDEGLWYRIAETNGLTGDRDLRVGQTINIPSVVASVHNNASTFKPYDPSKITGDTTPHLPMPEGDKGCGGVGLILVVIVAAAVTYFTAGATASYFGVAMSELSAASVAIGAGAAAVGSVVSQGVAMAVGLQEDFSWQQVGMAAIGGAVGGALVEYSAFAGNTTANVVTKAAISNALTQGIGVATGLQDKFSWRGVAAAAAGAGVGRLTADYLLGASTPGANGQPSTRVQTDTTRAFSNMFGSETQFMGAALSGMAGGLTTAAMRGGKISAAQIMTDAFGNAIGDAIGEELVAPIRDDLAALGEAHRATGSDAPLTDSASQDRQRREERGAILALFRDGPNEPSGSGYTEQEMLDGSRQYAILSDKRVVIPWEGDQPATSTNSNFFGIEPSDHRGLSPDSATADSSSRANSYGDDAALHTEITNDPLLRARRDAADTAFVQEKYRENVENRRRILDSFEADALKLAAEPTAERPARWVDQRSPVLGPVADMANDLAIRVGRDNPSLGGALQVLRLATIGDGSNADLLLAAAPLGFSRLAKLEAKVGGEVASGRRIGDAAKGANRLGPTVGVLEDGAFAQVPAKSTKTFSEEGQKIYSQAAGRPIQTVKDLADALKQGVVKPSQVPLDYVVIDGQKVISNTRSSTALINADIPKSQWFGVDKSGVKAYGDVTFDDLVRNQLNKNYGGSVQKARR